MTRHRRGQSRGRQSMPGAGAEPAGDSGWLRELAAIAGDPARWPGLDEDTLLLLVFEQCLFFAHTGDPGAASALAELYPHLASRVASGERLELLERVTSAVEENGTPVPALLPFLQHEPEPALVALAATAYATLAPIEGGEPLSGPQAVLHMAEHAEDEGTRVGLLAGLLELGDRRIVPLALAGWGGLPEAARLRLAELRSPSSLAFMATAEFWLGAMEAAEGPAFAAAAGALARLAAEADPPRVLDVWRKLPAQADDGRDTLEVMDDRSLAEFGRRMEPRLAALAARQGADAPLREVRERWGLVTGA